MQYTDNFKVISKIDAWCYRVPIAKRVETSFGAMTSRPAVFVRLEDSDGAFGWGEIFANWPAAGAEHRVRLLMEDVSDLVLGRVFAQPSDLFERLISQTHIRALQCGEWGSFAHVISGLDIAFNDLLARRAGVPLAQFLNLDAVMSVPTYASGIHIRDADRIIDESRALGFDAFKVKVGFDLDTDIEGVKRICATLGDSERLFTDANQAWSAAEAIRFLEALKDHPVGWLEEPLPADAPIADWQRVATGSNIPLAGGENIVGDADFANAIGGGIFDVIQPDVAKWGGVSKCREVGLKATVKGRLYCPHFLGGGIGLAASAAVLASIKGAGLLEVDSNENPLRGAFDLWKQGEDRSQFHLSDQPGMGITKLPEAITEFESLSATVMVPGAFTYATRS
ncbi:MAG: mandelate racemase/muconate lactonizing enzyme family protein [Yoonia sp.]|uniref:mandelate racemase/muconate lactonizing enzyme family protein n=1 Tax=Yoonia sp. TaxID=2212373 RepID=UPI003EF694A7